MNDGDRAYAILCTALSSFNWMRHFITAKGRRSAQNFSCFSCRRAGSPRPSWQCRGTNRTPRDDRRKWSTSYASNRRAACAPRPLRLIAFGSAASDCGCLRSTDSLGRRLSFLVPRPVRLHIREVSTAHFTHCIPCERRSLAPSKYNTLSLTVSTKQDTWHIFSCGRSLAAEPSCTVGSRVSEHLSGRRYDPHGWHKATLPQSHLCRLTLHKKLSFEICQRLIASLGDQNRLAERVVLLSLLRAVPRPHPTENVETHAWFDLDQFSRTQTCGVIAPSRMII